MGYFCPISATHKEVTQLTTRGQLKQFLLENKEKIDSNKIKNDWGRVKSVYS